eukprot:2561921-Karenia_brevis.AAC.1
MCSLAEKAQPPPICVSYGCLSGGLVHYWEGLCCSELVTGVVFSQLRFMKKEAVDSCRVEPTFAVGKCNLIFNWKCGNVEHEVSVRLL